MWISRYDSDQHLKQTFAQAMHHARPQGVIFLGDLMDEGAIADDKNYENYFRRFKKIFKTHRNVKKIYLPGDNDVGGEWPVEKVKSARFKSFFGKGMKWRLQTNLLIYNINLINNETAAMEPDEFNSTHVLISHVPVIHRPSLESHIAVAKLNPCIIFSGHNHRSTEVIADDPSLKYQWTMPINSLKVFDLENLKEKKKIVEIQVTTCSYRMGTFAIGYGQAVFDNGKLKYSPMFVITRFYQVSLYLITLFAILLFNVCYKRKSFKYDRLDGNS